MTASPESLQQRYKAIERVYSGRQWDDVARMSAALLLEVPDEASNPLRQRLQLLLGHTYLYGYENATTATGYYNLVRTATSEAVLRDIADQGLVHCAELAQALPLTAEPAQAAMPWMNKLVVDVIDEPELIELAQANPATVEEVEIVVSGESPGNLPSLPTETINVPGPEELAELSKGLLRVVIR